MFKNKWSWPEISSELFVQVVSFMAVTEKFAVPVVLKLTVQTPPISTKDKGLRIINDIWIFISSPSPSPSLNPGGSSNCNTSKSQGA